MGLAGLDASLVLPWWRRLVMAGVHYRVWKPVRHDPAEVEEVELPVMGYWLLSLMLYRLLKPPKKKKRRRCG